MRTNPFATSEFGIFPEVFAAHLYRLHPATLTLIPELAADDVPPSGRADDKDWVVTVELNEGLTWSDGESIDAFDVEYTFEDLARIGNPAEHGWEIKDPNGDADLLSVKALDRYTAEFRFSARPGIERWQLGVATASILPEHYWVFTFADRSFQRQQDSELGFDAPSAGGYRFGDTTGDVWTWVAVEDWWNSGSEYVVHADGSISYQNLRLGITELYGGHTESESIAAWTEGPYASRIEWKRNESALKAVISGDADVSIDSGTSRPSDQITTLVFGKTGSSILNISDRAALSCFIFATDLVSLLTVEAISADNSWLPGGAWSAGNATDPCPGNELERFSEGIKRLRDAGWEWADPPEWGDNFDIHPGAGLMHIDGRPRSLRILAPSEETDPISAVISEWIREWLTDIGFDVTLREGTPTAIDPVDWDLGLVTQSLGIPPVPFVAIDPDVVSNHLRTSSLSMARSTWEITTNHLRDNAQVIPLLRTIIVGEPSASVMLPFTSFVGGNDLGLIATAVRLAE